MVTAEIEIAAFRLSQAQDHFPAFFLPEDAVELALTRNKLEKTAWL